MISKKLTAAIIMLAAAWITPQANTMFLESITGCYIKYNYFYKDFGNGVFKVAETDCFEISSNNIREHYVYDYDADGRTVSITAESYAYETGDLTKRVVTTYNYDADGRMVSELKNELTTFDNSTKNTFTEYKYGTDGQLILINIYDGCDTSGKIMSYEEYQYYGDAYDILFYNFNEETGEEKLKMKRSYSAEGKLLEETWFSTTTIYDRESEDYGKTMECFTCNKYVYDEETGFPKFRIEYYSVGHEPADADMDWIYTYGGVEDEYAAVQKNYTNGVPYQTCLVKYNKDIPADATIILPEHSGLYSRDEPKPITMDFYRNFSKHPIDWTGNWSLYAANSAPSPLVFNPSDTFFYDYGEDYIMTRNASDRLVKYTYSETMPSK